MIFVKEINSFIHMPIALEMWLQYLSQIFGILFSLGINKRTFGNLEVQMGVPFKKKDLETKS